MMIFNEINWLTVIASIAGLLSLYFFITLLFKVKQLSIIGITKKTVSLLFFLAITGFCLMIIVGTVGYHRLTEEELVAKIKVNSYEPQSFQARMTFSNGDEQVFLLKGDELLIDAYVLKWKSWANLLGFHPAYRLERISGRYKSIEQEKNNSKSVYSISTESDNPIYEWRKSYEQLGFLLDVEHGSASFVDAENGKEYLLMVTTSGLLIRPSNSSEI
jgi:hypothetical protein